jgi:phosphoglycerate dehydrogenase-like enzyme
LAERRSTFGYRHPAADGHASPSELPFETLPNVLMTPHSSGVAYDTFVGRVDDIAANIGRLHRASRCRISSAVADGTCDGRQ